MNLNGVGEVWVGTLADADADADADAVNAVVDSGQPRDQIRFVASLPASR